MVECCVDLIIDNELNNPTEKKKKKISDYATDCTFACELRGKYKVDRNNTLLACKKSLKMTFWL